MLSFKTVDLEDFTLVHFETDGHVSPEELKSLKPPTVKGSRGVVLSGRGPIWLYAFLVHWYHPTLWVATYDPRLGGAVVVEVHGGNVKVGDVVPLNVDELLE
ncbi:hypothetical protein APY94_04200 [Thermococcus celericrescens]|uniref:CRISPR-associated protein Csx3 n=1 Tax=Thermococcus celericrescens TaxID=227598 RepID=A0A100XYM4_9EURY|nr:CRISPR-associated ring nuclease Crn3/Csx3 [Thermococcus celericrescens]KUH33938.1 hypothetical protein APY94_04200 [Thermococcus celericrescens]